MGHMLFYYPGEKHIGGFSIRRWEEASKLLPLLVDFINRAMQKDWGPGTVRDLRVFAGGVTDPQVPPPDQSPPATGPFALDRMLSEERLGENYIHIFEAREWDRLFAWCDFLVERDGAYALYEPLVEVLRSQLAGIDQRQGTL